MEKKSTKRKKWSARKCILTAVTLVQIPFIVMYFFMINNFTGHVQEEQWGYQLNTMNTYVRNLQNEITEIDKFLYSDCQLKEPEERKADSKLFVEENIAITQLVFFNKEGILQERYSKSDVSNDLSGTLIEDVGWQLVNDAGIYYMVRRVSTPDGYAGAVISIGRLSATSSNNYNIPGSVLFMRSGECLNSTLWQRRAEEQIPERIEHPYLVEAGNRKYMLSETNLLGMRLLYGVIYTYNFDWLYYFGYTLLTVVVIVLLVVLLFMDQAILSPVKKMSQVMEKIGDGNMDLRLAEEKSIELDCISTTFNTMMDHLKTAKIESYEQRLTARRAKMDALRLQIRRHFFLNCLKNIYAMASTGDIDSIKRTSLLLSSNLRYTLNFDANSVPLQEELKMCEDYIHLQGIGQAAPPMLVIENDPNLNDFAIPPVSLLTILENSCKYGTRQDGPLIIRIQTSLKELDDQHYAYITVRDNGSGFEPEMLRLLNNDMEQVKGQNHIGMANTLLRFRMLYGEECSMLFSNNDGAKVDLIIPMDGKSEVQDETVDRG